MRYKRHKKIEKTTQAKARQVYIRTDADPSDPSDQSHAVLQAYTQAKARRDTWDPLWKACYDYAWPQRSGIAQNHQAGQLKGDHLFDSTAVDAVDQLSASLLGNLTPIWSQWFGFKPGPDMPDAEADRLAPILEKAAKTVQDHFDRSNFAVEIHQCYLDLIVGGTGSLYFEEAEPGADSAFKFKACALKDVVLEEGESGYLDHTYRPLTLTLKQIMKRYPDADVPQAIVKKALSHAGSGGNGLEATFDVLEAVYPEGLVYRYNAILQDQDAGTHSIAQGQYDTSPFMNFRWLKSPGEMYGRSPVMKALPDIKTANKVVELTLKNASIAVAGIWQADDDGVLNPANIQLKPGSIIPKAQGSAGLQPLDMPGRFDVSQLVLDSLQARIRHALLADQLAPLVGPHMTATEVIERSSQMALLLGATYGRLQAELLTPLIKRAFAILRRRGEIPDVALDGRFTVVDYRSPLARAQGQRNVHNTLSWVNAVLAMGPEAAKAVDVQQVARFLGEALGVPSDVMVKDVPTLTDTLRGEVEDLLPLVETVLEDSGISGDKTHVKDDVFTKSDSGGNV